MKTDYTASIVNQLFDLAEVTVKKRQEINDIADTFVKKMLNKYEKENEYPQFQVLDPREPILPENYTIKQMTIKEILEAVFKHGKETPEQSHDLPKDQMTIFEAIEKLNNLLKE